MVRGELHHTADVQQVENERGGVLQRVVQQENVGQVDEVADGSRHAAQHQQVVGGQKEEAVEG